MTKTQGVYEKHPRDYYKTPFKAVEPLKGFLSTGLTFCEPCAGDGALVKHIESLFQAECFLPMDIEPQADWIIKGDAINLSEEAVQYCDLIITNPPFTHSILSPLMDKWINLKPTVLLLPADFIHNIRFAPYLKWCYLIKSIGRVKWIEDSKGSGVENYIWAFFRPDNVSPTEFVGRT